MDIVEFVEAVIESIDSGETNVDSTKSFIENGGYSLAAVRLSDIVFKKTQIVMNFFDIMGDESLQALLSKINEAVVSDNDEYADVDEGVL
ncbi:hypothetical protein SAMN05421686_11614 [Thalassolituus maritimus]|uniref:Phosphopantetheine attachment site n=1 Tax=Thalassolituus maritimus TaxID=484498 RepID=A0A1N7Q985_9GAMM|nr:hypothetical protein [Thalassolituus maritimus]SIT19376.1 hypothetical protein SAMN05421686_11614 [Thalassolituus maritimus]